MSPSYSAIAVGAIVAIAYTVTARQLLQATDPGSLPEACISGGLALQGACAAEIEGAQKYFGLEGANASSPEAAANISSTAIEGYLAVAPPATPACCAAACEFNANLCSCDPGVLALVSSFTGNNPGSYTLVAQTFSQVCNFTAYINETCPTGDLAAIPKPYGAPCLA